MFLKVSKFRKQLFFKWLLTFVSYHVEKFGNMAIPTYEEWLRRQKFPTFFDLTSAEVLELCQ